MSHSLTIFFKAVFIKYICALLLKIKNLSIHKTKQVRFLNFDCDFFRNIYLINRNH